MPPYNFWPSRRPGQVVAVAAEDLLEPVRLELRARCDAVAQTAAEGAALALVVRAARRVVRVLERREHRRDALLRLEQQVLQIRRIVSSHDLLMKVVATPVLPQRPVRPIRWT